MSLKIKVCGMLDPVNILEAAKLKPDFMGFIFYRASSRFATGILDREITSNLPDSIKKTGVFVNANLLKVKAVVRKYSLDLVQLHGNETPELCRMLTEEGIKVIKAFPINVNTSFKSFSDFIPYTEYFLFDTSTTKFGGSGNKFDWRLLDKYHLTHPFFLSGGISEHDVKNILEVSNPYFHGIDLNSRFEIKPGLKNIETLKKFINEIRFNSNAL
jgi:phosphoribosylanthranilate isomerase